MNAKPTGDLEKNPTLYCALDIFAQFFIHDQPLFPAETLEGELCVQLYNPYPFSPNPSCVAIPNHPDNRPLSELQESGQPGRSAPKYAHQSNPGLLGRARAPVRLNQNRNDRTAWASAGHTELASQSEAARVTRLFATGQPGINGTRLYRGIGVIPEDYRKAYRNRGMFHNRGLFYNVYL